MITSLRSCRCLSRRHFARISISDMFGESSMNSGASVSSPIVRAIFVQSLSSSLPWRSFCNGIRASAESNRMVISVRLISRLKMTEVMPCLIDAARAMSRPSVDFPMAGLAARTIICPGCRPWVSRSRSANPVGTPAIDPVAVARGLDLVDRALDDLRRSAGSPRTSAARSPRRPRTARRSPGRRRHHRPRRTPAGRSGCRPRPAGAGRRARGRSARSTRRWRRSGRPRSGCAGTPCRRCGSGRPAW